MPTTPAGWYPDPQQPHTQRYWDGMNWTEHTAPLTPAPEPIAQPAASARYTPPTPYTPPAPQPAATRGTPTSRNKWLIGGGIAAGVIVVGSIGAALGSSARAPDPEPTPAAVAAVVTPTPTPTPTAAEPEPEETAAEPVEANPVAFMAQANSHLDDINKDLDDLVVTVQEDGFWRLLSNYGEISFNLGQLEALDVPESVTGTWVPALEALDGTIDVLGDAVSTQDGPTILNAIDELRAQVEATRAVVNTAG